MADEPPAHRDEILGSDEIAAWEPLRRLVHGDEIPGETLAMLRNLRLSAIERVLREAPPERPIDDA